MNPRAVVIILNWNKPDDTLECLDSCLAIDYDNFEVLIVDNASTDDSVGIFLRRYPGLRVIRNAKNLGFAGGNNAGIAAALALGADYVFMLNNDTIVEKSSLKELLTATAPDVGIVGPKVLYYHDRGIVNSMGTSIDWFRSRPREGYYGVPDEGLSPEVAEKEVIHGCALFVSASLIRKIGAFDEKFFIFHEESDWCFRSRKAGFRNLVAPRAGVYHKESKTMREFSLLTHYYSTRNFLYLAKRNASSVDFLKSRFGFLYLLTKNAAMIVFGGEKEKKFARTFFLGTADYFVGRMGKCRRKF